jgi:hypothetical protein
MNHKFADVPGWKEAIPPAPLRQAGYAPATHPLDIANRRAVAEHNASTPKTDAEWRAWVECIVEAMA